MIAVFTLFSLFFFFKKKESRIKQLKPRVQSLGWFAALLCVSGLCLDAFARLEVAKVAVYGLVQVCFECISLTERDKHTQIL